MRERWTHYFYRFCMPLRSVTSGGNPMSEAEMDNYTIRGLREEARAAGRPPKPLVSLRPQDSLHAVIGKLFRNRCSMAPVLFSPDGAGACMPRISLARALVGVLEGGCVEASRACMWLAL